MADAIAYTADNTATDPSDRHRASLTLAEHATDTDELLQWLDMLGLPPCERALRSNGRQHGYYVKGAT